MMMRTLAYLVMAIAGTAIGVASALWMAGLWTTKKPMEFSNIIVDGWMSDFAVGSKEADPYTRTRVARHGLLALAKSEAVYFVRGEDNEGRALTSSCDYRISGTDMPASWWSITLYSVADSKLPMNDDEALSVDATSITRETEDAPWEAVIAPTRPADTSNWISSRNAQGFDLLLRLYVPDEDLLNAPEATLPPPSIERLGCKGDPA